MFGELRSLYQEYTSHQDTLSVVQVDKKNNQSPETDGFDCILLIVKRDNEKMWQVKHYQIADKTIALHIVSHQQLIDWIEFSTYRRIIQWVNEGKVLFDRNEYLSTFKQELDRFPIEQRELKLTQEYAKSIRTFKEAVQLYERQEALDCFNKVLRTLHSIGRLSVIEEGFYPELTGWQQIKRLDTGTYKLYEELVTSEKPVKERVELMLLAMDFTISNKLTIGSRHLFNIMGDDVWKISELKEKVEVFDYHLDLTMLIQYLVEKRYILTKGEETKNPNITHRYYQVNPLIGNK